MTVTSGLQIIFIVSISVVLLIEQLVDVDYD